MIITYAKSDVAASDTFLLEHVQELTVIRSPPFNYASIKKQVVKVDGEAGKFTYRHYVPFQRIWLAIHDWIVKVQPTRVELYQTLEKICTKLQIGTDVFLDKYAADMKVRRSFDLYVDFAINAICNWGPIFFYGPGTGDHGGNTLDSPAKGKQSSKQLARVMKAALDLQNELKAHGIELSIADKVSIHDVADGTMMNADWDDEEVDTDASGLADGGPLPLPVEDQASLDQIDAGKVPATPDGS